MIEEIEAPLPTIQNCDAKKAERELQKQRLGTLLAYEEVAFNRDFSMIEEFSKTNNISYSLAEAMFIAFFEEIKRNLMDGKIIRIANLGMFYISGPRAGKGGGFAMPYERTPIKPKLQVFYSLRKLID